MKIDLKTTVATHSARKGRFDIVDVASARFFMIDGRGDPNTSEEYAAALATMYPVAYKVKFLSKRELGRDYVVMPIEALWWADDMEAFTSSRDKAKWRWTVMGKHHEIYLSDPRRTAPERLRTILRQPVAATA